MPPGYQCCICKGTVTFASPQGHVLDPCALVIIGHADKEWREQKEQTYNCHFDCFRKLVGELSCLQIADADFETNGAVADAIASEETARLKENH